MGMLCNVSEVMVNLREYLLRANLGILSDVLTQPNAQFELDRRTELV